MPNNTLDLCKRLRDAGFPQKGDGVLWVEYRNGHGKIEIITVSSAEDMADAIDKGYDFTNDVTAYEPTIIELEEAVIEEMRRGERKFHFLRVVWNEDLKVWEYDADQYEKNSSDRFTAIASLWLKIRGMLCAKSPATRSGKWRK